MNIYPLLLFVKSVVNNYFLLLQLSENEHRSQIDCLFLALNSLTK